VLSLARSFAFAFSGLSSALISEKNFRLLWLCALGASLFNYLISFDIFYQIIFILVIFIILASELFNSALESCCDNQTLEHNLLIKKAKDLAAAGVFLLVIAAALFFLLIISHNFKLIYINILTKAPAFTALIFICATNFIICMYNLVSKSALILILINLIIHGCLAIYYTGALVFLILSLCFHLFLVISYLQSPKIT
jgi:diacylglycerol kinase